MKTGKKFKILIGIILSLLFIVTTVYASGGGGRTIDTVGGEHSFTNESTRQTVFLNLDGAGPSNKEMSRYPFSNKVVVGVQQQGIDASDYINNVQNASNKTKDIDAGITQIGFDLIYGYSKDLVMYKGEIPNQFATSTDSSSDIFRNVRYTSFANNVEGSTGARSADSLIFSKEGWDFDVNTGSDDTSVNSLARFQKLNDKANKEDDVRLVALLYTPRSTNSDGSLATSAFASFNIFEWISQFFVSLGMWLINIVFQIKGFDLVEFLSKTVPASSLGEAVNTVFLGSKGSVSPFLIICIIGLLVCITKAAFAYIKGNGAPQEIKNTLVLALVGLLIIGVALTNKAYTFASPVQTIVDKLLYGVNLNANSATDLFSTKTNSKNDAVIQKSVNLTQESRLKKIYIDMIIQQQFNTDLDDLTLGGTYLTSCTLYEYDGNKSPNTINSKYFANNLGYYYWYANSGVGNFPNATSNKAILKIDGYQTRKLENILNCLQLSLDAAKGNETKRQAILEMVKGFARPTRGSLSGLSFLFSIECVILAILLFKFVFPTLVAKVELLVSLLGLGFAGPLFLINNKKTVELGKSILALFVFSMVKLTLYGLVVTLIIYIIEVLCKADLMSMIITITVSVMGIMVSGQLKKSMDKMLNSMITSVAPQLQTARNSLRKFAGKQMSRASVSGLGTKVDSETGEVTSTMFGKIMGLGSDLLEEDGIRDRKKRRTERDTERGKRSAEAVSQIQSDYSKVKERRDNIKKEIEYQYNNTMVDEFLNDDARKELNAGTFKGISNYDELKRYLDKDKLKSTNPELYNKYQSLETFSRKDAELEQQLSSAKQAKLKNESDLNTLRNRLNTEELSKEQRDVLLKQVSKKKEEIDKNDERIKKLQTDQKENSSAYVDTQEEIYNTMHRTSINNVDKKLFDDYNRQNQKAREIKEDISKGKYEGYDSRIFKDQQSVNQKEEELNRGTAEFNKFVQDGKNFKAAQIRSGNETKKEKETPSSKPIDSSNDSKSSGGRGTPVTTSTIQNYINEDSLIENNDNQSQQPTSGNETPKQETVRPIERHDNQNSKVAPSNKPETKRPEEVEQVIIQEETPKEEPKNKETNNRQPNKDTGKETQPQSQPRENLQTENKPEVKQSEGEKFDPSKLTGKELEEKVKEQRKEEERMDKEFEKYEKEQKEFFKGLTPSKEPITAEDSQRFFDESPIREAPETISADELYNQLSSDMEREISSNYLNDLVNNEGKKK